MYRITPDTKETLLKSSEKHTVDMVKMQDA